VPGTAERRFAGALAAFERALRETGAPWMVIGGTAVVARGVRRLTVDVDVVVRGDAVLVDDLVDALGRQRFAPRTADALAFAKRSLVLLLIHRPSGVPFDVSLGWSGFEQAALARATVTPYGRARVPMATAEDLVVFKAVAHRPQDMTDIETLVALHPDINLARVRESVATLAELADQPEIVSALEAVLARARNTLRSARSRPAKKKRKR
jgi:predicted nucleotidyltransferase